MREENLLECPECGSGDVHKKEDPEDSRIFTVYECGECGYTRRKRSFERNYSDESEDLDPKSKAVLAIIVLSSLGLTIIATLYY